MATLAQRRRALQAADELLNELGIDQEQPVQVFGIIDEVVSKRPGGAETDKKAA